MATDGSDPPPCDPDVFKNGKVVCVLLGASNAVERWVKSVAEATGERVDWHYSCGRARVLHLGSAATRVRVLEAIGKLRQQAPHEFVFIAEE